MTILIHFHQSHYRTFKAYYTEYVLMHRRAEFPALVSYNRFVELTPSVMVPLLAYLQQRQGNCTGLSFVDATTIKVCHNKRIPRHQLFAGSAARGKTSMGWFYGFKLHLCVNDRDEIAEQLIGACKVPAELPEQVALAIEMMNRKLRDIESSRALTNRSERSRLASESQPIQDAIDKVLFHRYGLSDDDALYVEKRLAEML